MASQKKNARDVFKKYFQIAITPDRIIELGTAGGEFTHWICEFRKEINGNFDFFSMDFIKYPTELPPTIRTLDEKHMVYCELEIFSHIDFIGSLIKERTLILCDNGNKPREVQLLTPYLKKDCVIMAHDYFYSQEEFERVGGWPVCEITWDDVKDLGLDPYNQELMAKALWLSLIKR